MFLSICIPTYNRANDLEKNVKGICSIISELGREDIDIYVVDNNSTDDTYIKMQAIISENARVHYRKNEENIGAPKNLIRAYLVSDSEYVMLLGDDDFFSKEYLEEVMSILEVKQPEMVLGNYVGIDGAGNAITQPREPIGETFSTDDYRNKVMWGLSLAHQLSGLVYRKRSIDEKTMESLLTTMYPQSYLAMQNAEKGVYYHILNNPIRVTQTNTKDWHYDASGFLFDLLSGFYYLPISKKEKKEFEKKALSTAGTAWRLSLTYRHPVKVFREVIKENRLEPGFKAYFVLYYCWKWIKHVMKKVFGALKPKKGK